MAALGDLSTSIQNQERRWQLLPKHHLTVWGGHLRNPKTWVKKMCVFRKIHHVINFWEVTYIYVYMCEYMCTCTYIQCSCNETKSFWIFRQRYPSLALFKTDGVNPGSESWELSAMTGFVLELFFTWIWSNGINVIWTLEIQPEPRKSFAPFPCYLKSLSWKRLQF